MKKFLLNLLPACLLSLQISNSHAQGFIWAKGSNTINASGIYGNVGVVNSGNNPGARYGASSWKDANGNFWLFGGNGYDALGNQGRLNDLWKYDVVNNTWTWINGTNIIAQVGIYGIQGVSSNTVKPGSRSNAMSWFDNSGNVYLFGGFGYDAFANLGNLNDLWKYNPVTNQWTWIKGSNSCFQAGNYGTMGTAANSNMPGARNDGTVWKDNSGNLWLFGGLGITSNTATTVSLNDLWKYDVAANQWTWISGTNLSNQNGTYGSIGVPSATTMPGGRFGASAWMDASGNLLLFGGSGFDASSLTSGFLNDLWKYDLTNNQWVWLKGNNTKNQNGVYGSPGIPATTNLPGSRADAMTWQDTYGNYWLSAGNGYSALNQGSLNDVWIYNTTSNNWTWIAGPGNGNLPGVYGTMNSPGPSNVYGARFSASNWLDANNNLFVFGGMGMAVTGTQGYLNDTWKYTNCVINPISMTITSSNALPCAKETVSLSVSGSNSYTWQTVPSSSLSYIVISPTVTSTYSVITSNTNSCIYMASYTQSVNTCLSVSEFTKAPVPLLYPNPSNGKVYIDLNTHDSAMLEVFSLSGELLFEEKLEHSQLLSCQLPRGIYVYRCQTSGLGNTYGKLLIE
jgi:N-acetylneuraminic acid mutarotase